MDTAEVRSLRLQAEQVEREINLLEMRIHDLEERLAGIEVRAVPVNVAPEVVHE